MSKYLYGASVQGIQDFIFQTNKLKEIVGASELVERICTTAFDDYGGKAEEGKSVLRAAGNIKHIFNNKKDCEKAVLNFPREVMTLAPGITISQAVVEMKDSFADYSKAANELEQRLRTQRNKSVRSLTLGLLAISRAPSTGLPAISVPKEVKGKNKIEGLIDDASVQKLKRADATRKLMNKIVTEDKLKELAKDDERAIEKLIANDIEDLEDKNSWIAVIHADGNGMGNIVQAVCKNPKDAQTFSTTIESINKKAVQEAYKEIEKIFLNKKNKGIVIPLRPIVLGGDDLTLICRANLAVQFTKIFMETFENESESQLKNANWEQPDWRNAKGEPIEKKLTVCAGISFVKSSYPFHYAVDLAESLCGRAKKAAKKIDADLAPSCLMFHKVQDSFVEDFKEIAERELTPKPNLSFEYGPYYCGKHPQRPDITVEKLLSEIEKFKGKEGNAIKSHLRQWLSLLFDNVDAANQKMKRLRTVNKQAADYIPAVYEDVVKVSEGKIPYHDILSLTSILTQETKKGESNNE